VSTVDIYCAPASDAVEFAHEFSLMAVDPPYSRHVHAKAVSVNPGGRESPVASRDLGFAHLTPAVRRDIARTAAGVRGWSCVFSDVESAHLWRFSALAAGAEYIRAIPWVRWSQPQLSGDRPPTGAELVSLFHSGGQKHWSGPGSLVSMPDGLIPFVAKSLRGKDKFSCEKPLDIMLSIVSWFSDVGDRVVDPCCGSGTTGLAARILGRDAVLLDVNPAAVALSALRRDSPLSKRDAERTARWVEYQRAWLAASAPNTRAGRARYDRAAADTERAAAWL
jgi:hypothetical protein